MSRYLSLKELKILLEIMKRKIGVQKQEKSLKSSNKNERNHRTNIIRTKDLNFNS